MNTDQQMQIDFLKVSLKKPIILIGLMGAGKSRLGKCIAEKLALKFIDSDEVIVGNHGSISDIFAKQGEAAFRAIERDTIEQLLGTDRIVLSTGGGAFIQAATRAIIQEKSHSLWINADLSTLYERVKHKTHRPLLETGEDKQVILQRLIDARYPVYAQAEITVKITDDMPTKAETIEQNCRRLIDGLYTHLSL